MVDGKDNICQNTENLQMLLFLSQSEECEQIKAQTNAALLIHSQTLNLRCVERARRRV